VGVRSQFPAAVPRERSPVPIVEEAGWAQGMSGRIRRRKYLSSPPGSPGRTARSHRVLYPSQQYSHVVSIDVIPNAVWTIVRWELKATAEPPKPPDIKLG